MLLFSGSSSTKATIELKSRPEIRANELCDCSTVALTLTGTRVLHFLLESRLVLPTAQNLARTSPHIHQSLAFKLPPGPRNHQTVYDHASSSTKLRSWLGQRNERPVLARLIQSPSEDQNLIEAVPLHRQQTPEGQKRKKTSFCPSSRINHPEPRSYLGALSKHAQNIGIAR